MKEIFLSTVLITAFILVIPVTVGATDIPARKIQLDWLIYAAGGNDNLGRINAAGEVVPLDETVSGQFSYNFTSEDGTVKGRVEGDNGEIRIIGDTAAHELAIQFTRHFATMTRAGHDHAHDPLPNNPGGQAAERYPIDFRPRDGNATNIVAANNVHVRNRTPDEFIIFFYDSRDDGGMMSGMWLNGVTKWVSDLQPNLATTEDGLRLAIGSRDFTLNGTAMQSDAAPFIDSGNRTMIPLRIVAEGLGANVDWNGRTRTVTVSLNGETIQLTIDVPLLDNMGIPVIVNNLTFVPVRYVSEALGANVRWDGEAQAVYIS
ncbi:MAG: copper amine oxidase N-terminal domain-containing protein [Defluviitaleaceae bacterium]|nr:copper amine oxidase N-terminal domain-containing protein [Defluviitaleaceae bacterium]